MQDDSTKWKLFRLISFPFKRKCLWKGVSSHDMPHHEVTTFHVTKFLAFTDKKLIVHTRMYVFHGEMYNN